MFDQAAANLTVLQQSPTFAMSRGGRELFHTNFWAFLLELDIATVAECERPIVEAVRNSLLRSLFGAHFPARVWVWRERASLDLVVIAAPEDAQLQVPRLGAADFEYRTKRARHQLPDLGMPCVVVEMKLKAIPTYEQIEAYTKKLEKPGLALDLPLPVFISEQKIWGRLEVQLTSRQPLAAEFWAYPPAPEPDDDVDPPRRGGAFAGGLGQLRLLLIAPGADRQVAGDLPWEILPPSDVISAMRCAFDQTMPAQGPEPGALLTAILNDYLTSTDCLLELASSVQAETVDNFVGQKLQPITTLRNVYQSAVSRRFSRARLHDLVGKQAYSVIGCRLLAWVCQNGVPKFVTGLDSGTIDGQDAVGSQFVLQTETLLTRGMPGLNLHFLKCWSGKGNRTKRSIRLGLQIQAGGYRHFIAVSNSAGNDLKDFANTEMMNPWTGAEAAITGIDGVMGEFTATRFVHRQWDVGSFNWTELRELVSKSMQTAARLLEDPAVRKALTDLVV